MKKVTINILQEMKRQRQKIVTVTSYDYTTTKLLNESGVDIILVGDSLGMVKLGYSSTLPVTMDDMVYHTKIVARANTAPLLVGDMPYLSYQVSIEEAIRNAGKLLKAGAEAVKLEGGIGMVPTIKALRSVGIPVMGHIGMTPQSVKLFGGYKVQGRKSAQAKKIVADAKALEKAGAFSIVLECVPSILGRQVTKAVKIPVIGIGAGVGCDGQVLVVDDLLGLTDSPSPKFVKRYADLRGTVKRAVREYAKEVRSGEFPDEEHSYA